MKDLIIRDGTDQNHRFPVALETGYFNVDELKLESLAGMGADFSSSLSYYTLENTVQGNWKELFSSDEAVIFAMIISFDLNRQMTWFTHLSKQKENRNLVLQNYRLAEKINYWYETLLTINNNLARDCCRRIRHLIEKKLRPDLNMLQALYTNSKKGDDNHQIDFTRLKAIWHTNETGHTKDHVADQSPEENDNDRLHSLTTCFYSFYNGIMLLKDYTAILLEKSLKSQIHSPSTGLYLAFLRLFEKIQEEQNLFTSRHLDFYYNEILKCRVQNPVPDKAYLCFKKAPGTENVFLPKGTGFSAPKGKNNHPRAYLSDNDLVVGSARVESLKTLFYERDGLVSPESDMNMITSARINTIPLMESMDLDETQTGWPIFGAEANRAMSGTQQNASLGFAVAAPVLLLREGKRKVFVCLQLARHKEALKEDALFAFFLEKAASLIETTPEDIFFKVFSKIFNISLTTEDGWLDIPDYMPAINRVDKKCDPNNFDISFELDSEIQPIVPWSEEIHGKGYDTKFPVIRFTVNNETYAYPCSILEDYFIKEIEIHAHVNGIKNLILHNHLGRLDPNTPFQPFGPMPAVGSYFIAGSYETSIKKTSDFNIELEWGELPPAKGGFKTHYREYGMGIDNTSFKAGVSVLQEGQWQPPAPDLQPRIDLMGNSTDKDKKIAGKTQWITKGIDLSRLDPNTTPEKDYGFDIKTRSGFFKFTITDPEQAFGHGEYPFLLTNVLVHNAKPPMFTKPKPMPNPPYTPMVNTITANYKAFSLIRPDLTASSADRQGEALFSLHPFGIRPLYPLPKQKKCFVIPDYHKQGHGNLFIGLSLLEPGSRLTLFFHLIEDSRADSTNAMPFVRWFYLKDNQWKEFTGKQVVSDTTSGFLSSGIVTLDIPEDINCDNTLFDEKLYWIRACADKYLTGACSLFSVQTHAVGVTLEDPAAHDGVLGPGSINQPLSNLPGINSITQPIPAFNGRAKETEHARKTRISERLKHKNRAVTPWDYERLILEKFPEVFKVKCFPGINSISWQCWKQRQMCLNTKHWNCSNCKTFNTQNQPGHLLVTVIPRFKKKDRSFSKDPEPIANAILLNRIKSYVKRLASVFASIEVQNPVYEKIQVRCTVRFKNRENLWGNKSRLNKAISDFISPWTDEGYKARFGWCIRRSELMSHIREQACVDFVTNFSMLRIAGNSQSRFELFDTVTGNDTRPREDEKQIVPRYPWSIAVNADHHFIETTSDVRSITPQKTGIEELEVGNTFIITG
ncbi:baseplate J/gp47 family protein [Desulfobacula phenolica]|uniref:Baseplate J-like protein n=1 Tax=Desulfobacula phenolica TaxID=90732 RepID=A0A1H2JQ97_9BACT|nr:baseplate J/gp47 family protein [Desulfobacula phenolica]SDU58326.1 Baseplate J-like protein [Desulfobacula phenolica]